MQATRSVLLLVAAALVLSACATQPIPDAYDPPGFFYGLLHGAVAPLALLGAIFMEIRIYAFPNSGWGYDCGFLLGIGAIWGGLFAST